MIEYPPCKKCGKSHKMALENMKTGEIEPLDVCRDCLFFGSIVPLTDQIILKEDES